MKKAIIVLTILVVGVASIFLITQNNKMKVEFKYEKLYLSTEPTFKFTANSKHFKMETGEAYYNDEDKQYMKREIIIKNFNMIKEIKNLKTYSLNIRFYDLPLMNNETHYQGAKDIKDFLATAELNYNCIFNSPGMDLFLQSKEEEFKDNLKISIKYCLTNDKCYEEKLKIKYID